MPVAIVTDSTSDIEPERAAELDIDIVPLFVIWGDKSYRDYIDLSRAQFYEKLAHEPNLPITSQPTAGMFEDVFKKRLDRGDEILCITLSSKVSGTINAATAAASRFPGAPITIFDSLSVAGGLGMMVLKAHELARDGSSVAQIVRVIERERETQKLYACLPDLSHIVRTGRVSKAQAAIGTLMKIVPVLTLRDGAVAAEAQVRTFARAQETMLDLSMRGIEDPRTARFLVMHTNAPELANSVVAKIRTRLHGAEPALLDVLEAGPVIAVHGGSGAVGIFSSNV
ncbi:MAG: DegV family protein [Candidatus Eremiobacteraeota bacterium]|nr:DegV family protein [Candidatus Eremiobacteraeota bacterium]